jgi:hypothetical protein
MRSRTQFRSSRKKPQKARGRSESKPLLSAKPKDLSRNKGEQRATQLLLFDHVVKS